MQDCSSVQALWHAAAALHQRSKPPVVLSAPSLSFEDQCVQQHALAHVTRSSGPVHTLCGANCRSCRRSSCTRARPSRWSLGRRTCSGSRTSGTPAPTRRTTRWTLVRYTFLLSLNNQFGAKIVALRMLEILLRLASQQVWQRCALRCHHQGLKPATTAWPPGV